VLPNSDYTPRKIYTLNGVGKLFYGNYYVKTATHTISGDAYTVSCDVLMVQKLVLKTRKKENSQLEVKAKDNPKFTIITIKRGDTLWDLSRKYGCTVQYLADINNINNPDLIYAGHKLKVPSK
jgi:LysM repeat protein